MTVVRTERGWAGHFIRAYDCLFRRNTLLELGDKRLVVSTVGNLMGRQNWKMEKLDADDSQFETMVFWAQRAEPYWEANVTKQVSTVSESRIRFKCEDDTLADRMHEHVVAEMIERLPDLTEPPDRTDG